MMNPNVIHSQTGKAVPLDTITNVGDIAANPANIASLCICITELSKERQLWLEPSKEMVLSGMAELNQLLNDYYNEGSNLEELSDNQLSDAVTFVLQAMAGKRNG